VVEEATDGLGSPDRDHGDAFGGKIPAATSGQRFEGGLVAHPFDEHDCAQVGVPFVHARSEASNRR
jgi:hypothetical protein